MDENQRKSTAGNFPVAKSKLAGKKDGIYLILVHFLKIHCDLIAYK